MIITKRTARKHIKAKNAAVIGTVREDNGQLYAIVDRYDLQRVDHYPIDQREADKIEATA